MCLDDVFQFTLPCRERLAEHPEEIPDYVFQFTLPCRERLAEHPEEIPDYVFQFTLPCRERLQDLASRLDEGNVSIHAPV